MGRQLPVEPRPQARLPVAGHRAADADAGGPGRAQRRNAAQAARLADVRMARLHRTSDRTTQADVGSDRRVQRDPPLPPCFDGIGIRSRHGGRFRPAAFLFRQRQAAHRTGGCATDPARGVHEIGGLRRRERRPYLFTVCRAVRAGRGQSGAPARDLAAADPSHHRAAICRHHPRPCPGLHAPDRLPSS